MSSTFGCAVAAGAYFEWIDDTGTPLGDVFEEISTDINQAAETLLAHQ